MVMILGHGAFILSVPLVLILFVLFIYDNNINTITRNKSTILISLYTLLIILAFTSLTYAHLVSDFGMNNVYSNSHSTQPLLFKVCGLWGNHEGSMLLWATILAIYTYSIVLLRNIPYLMYKWTVLSQFIFNLFFVLYTLLTSNPFLSNMIPIYNGKELNPILQDIVLSIHPPLIYLGYIGFSLPFSLTIGYLMTNNTHSIIWSHYVRIYNLIAWSFLTLGILLGSWWAYYELGWGGWWFWDPVENASLLPWILSTALMHTIISTKKTHTLIRWSVLLSCLTFYSSILGTFFVRSGFLDSVHSFAADSNRGLFILTFLVIVLVAVTIIYIYKWKFINTHYIYDIYSREGIILLNQIFFIYFYIIVSIGTFYPSIYEYFFNKSITIGPSFYNQAIIPVIVPFIILMILAIDTKWRVNLRNYIQNNYKYLLCIVFFSMSLVIYSYIHGYNSIIIYYPMVFILTCAMLSLIFYIPRTNFYRMIEMRLSHLGFIIFLFGVTLWYSFHKEAHHIMYPGDRFVIDNYEYVFRGINLLKGPNYDCFYGSYLILKEGILVGMLFPEKRHYFIQDFYTSKVDIHSNVFYDIHVIIGDGNIYTGWATSTYIFPFMSWIWIGGIALVLGSALSLYKQMNTR